MLQDSTEEQSSSSSSSSSKRGRYEYRDGSGPSSGQPPPSYSAQRVSFLIMLYIIYGALPGDVQGVISSLFCSVTVHCSVIVGFPSGHCCDLIPARKTHQKDFLIIVQSIVLYHCTQLKPIISNSHRKWKIVWNTKVAGVRNSKWLKIWKTQVHNLLWFHVAGSNCLSMCEHIVLLYKFGYAACFARFPV